MNYSPHNVLRKNKPISAKYAKLFTRISWSVIKKEPTKMIASITKKIGIETPFHSHSFWVYAPSMNPTLKRCQTFFSAKLKRMKAMVLDIFRTLTYGQKLQIAEGSVAVPLGRDDIETWVTKSEERNERAGKKIKPKVPSETKTTETKVDEGDKPMTNGTPTPTDPNCHPKDDGYFCWNPTPVPQCTTFCEFPSFCCEDDMHGLLEALYQFALAKKAANPSILKVQKKYSPNGSWGLLQLDFHLLGNGAMTIADIQAIVQYYKTLLGA